MLNYEQGSKKNIHTPTKWFKNYSHLTLIKVLLLLMVKQLFKISWGFILVNTQDYCFWSAENPHALRGERLYSINEIGIWAA